MALHSISREAMTAREREEYMQQKQYFELQSAHTLEVKKLDLELARQEAKWSVLIKLPLVIITLPVRILFGFAYIASMFTKKELPPSFWEFLK